MYLGITGTKERRTKSIDNYHMIGAATHPHRVCRYARHILNLRKPSEVRTPNNELKYKVPVVDLPVTISLWRQRCEEFGVIICFVGMGLTDVFTRKWRFLEGGGRPDSSAPGVSLSVPRNRVHCSIKLSYFLVEMIMLLMDFSFLITVVFFCFRFLCLG